MATTTGGTTYVTSTDLVANYPTASLALANRVDVVASGSMSKKTASYTVTVADILAGTTICMNSASATVLTLPSTGLVNGMMLQAFSVNTGAVTFTGGTVTGTVNSITSQYSGVSLTYDSAAAVWWCLPFGGAGAANFTNTATGTYTGFKYLTMTGNTSLVIDRAGFADILIIGGGGGGSRPGGGAGGYMSITSAYLTAQTYSVVVGAGGPAKTNGSASILGNFYGIGGGGAPAAATAGVNGGSGSGGFAQNLAGGLGLSGQGNNGGAGGPTAFPNDADGAGGGASAVGAVGGSGGVGGTGGAGTSSSITGSAVTRGGGGGGWGRNGVGSGGAGGGGAATGTTGVAGTINTGGGGGGDANTTGGAGGSGVVIIRVAV